MRCEECSALLDAFHDQELAAAERAAVQSHLDECPGCRAKYETLARTSQLLKEGSVRYPAPDVLKARIRGALLQQEVGDRPRAGGRFPWLPLAAAGLAIAVASSAATVALIRRGSGSPSIAEQVLASHLRSLMPNHLVDVASTDQHNVKPWFNGRVDLSPQVPALDSAGFPLIGGRLDYLVGRAVATVVYSRRQHVINVYSWPEAGPDLAESKSAAHGYHLVHWRSDGVEYWAVSDLNSAELAQFVGVFEGYGTR
jgi:anti-sigma factor RsiW